MEPAICMLLLLPHNPQLFLILELVCREKCLLLVKYDYFDPPFMKITFHKAIRKTLTDDEIRLFYINIYEKYLE